tara:strand:+ start:39162 stop:39413 length:252 start_codon:yes stop_codon:yes gene_type:complete
MTWQDILKEVRGYGMFSDETSEVEQILNKIHEQMEDFIDLMKHSRKKTLTEQAMNNIIQNMKKGAIDRLEKALDEFKEKLSEE